MKEIFSKLVDSSVVIPISSDDKIRLQEACDIYVKSIDVDAFIGIVTLLFFNKRCNGFIEGIKSNIEKEVLNRYRFNMQLQKALAQYCVNIMFEMKDIDENIKSICSLALMNVSVCLKSVNADILYPESLGKAIYYYREYARRKSSIKELNEKKIKPAIFEVESYKEIEGLNISETFEEVRYYACLSERLEYRNLVDTLSKSKIEDSYVKAYDFANKLSNQSWKFVDANPVKTLVELLGHDRRGKHSITEIKNKIVNSEEYKPFKETHQTSVLLSYFDDTTEISIGDIKLPPIELAVILYYENLFEYMMM